MFQTLVSLAIGIIIGWNFHLFYSSLDPRESKAIPLPPLISKIQNSTNTITIENNISTPKLLTTNVAPVENNQSSSAQFLSLLHTNHFSDAMALYLEGDEPELLNYKRILMQYFEDQNQSDPKRVIEELQHYMEIEPNNFAFKLYLIQIHRTHKEFDKALARFFELYETHEALYTPKVESEFHAMIEEYILELESNKEFDRLIQLFDNLIDRNFNIEKYTLRLAQLYYDLESYHHAEPLLHEIAYDNTYGAKAQTLLSLIQHKKKERQHYTHMVPLSKVGSQYSIQLMINQIPLTLLLDTGASYTFIDEDKVPSLQVNREIFLNTAGGKIVAHLATADTLSIQDLELNDVEVTLAPFKREHADGLLGMNFFSQFDFKIDQDKQLLYLRKKS